MIGGLFRIAWKEFLGGLPRFGIYLACLGLGAFAIAASGSTTLSFRTGVTAQARMLLGGDVAFTAAQRQATPDELAFLEARGEVAETAMFRTMVESANTRKQADMRAVDNAFPLLGAVELSTPGLSLPDALAFDGDRWGVAVSQSFLDDLALSVGEPVQIGTIPARITARIVSEPDRIGEPGAFQPAAFISIEAVRESGRLSTGSLFRANYLVRLTDPAEATALEEEAKQALGVDGLRYRGPEDAVDGLENILDLLNSFLVVVGVASLVAGGLGISLAVSAFLESRTGSIAALKAFGASASDIRLIYLVQLAALAAAGSLAGVALGSFAPYVLALIAGDAIPLPQVLAFYPEPLALAFLLAMLTAALFSLPALGRARATSPSALFRRLEPPPWRKSLQPETIAALVAALALFVSATVGSTQPLAASLLLLGGCAGWLVLLGAAHVIRLVARRAANRASGLWRLMLSNLGGPGSLAPMVAPALGLGLSILCMVAMVQSNLLRQLGETAPANAPSLVFSQVPNLRAQEFDALLGEMGVDLADPEAYRRVPIILARIASVKGVPAEEARIAESERWVAGREIQITYLADKPSEVSIVRGAWWTPDYDGPLLVSVETGVANGLGLSIGDTLGFRIFGREVEASVASIRQVDWGGFGVNMPFILSPGILSAANPQNFAVARVPQASEQPIIDAVGRRFPDVIVFQAREALATATKVLGDISITVNAIAGVVIAAGLLVLAGALSAIARRRRMESALLKTVGATRGRLLGLYSGELALVGLISAIIGIGIGTIGAWLVVQFVFEARWHFPWVPVATITALAMTFAAAGGAAVGLRLLSQRPGRVLSSQ